MASLYQDLKADTANLGNLIKGKTEDIANYRYLIFSKASAICRKLQALLFWPEGGNAEAFLSHGWHHESLENSGGLRWSGTGLLWIVYSRKAGHFFLRSIQDFEGNILCWPEV